jgi:hypothetical protein
MRIANSLWGAPRIHGELLKLGIDIGQASVAKYMAKRRDPPSLRRKSQPPAHLTLEIAKRPWSRSRISMCMRIV